MNRNDPVLLAALATMPLDDRIGIERQLAAIERRLEVIAAMLPGKPFAAVYLKAAGLLVRAIYESTHAVRCTTRPAVSWKGTPRAWRTGDPDDRRALAPPAARGAGEGGVVMATANLSDIKTVLSAPLRFRSRREGTNDAQGRIRQREAQLP